jgi:hypothetical protein
VILLVLDAGRDNVILKTDRFLNKLEKLISRRVRPLPIGRPRVNKKNVVKMEN